MKRKQNTLIDKISVTSTEEPYSIMIDVEFVPFYDNKLLYKGFYLLAKRQIIKDLATVGVKKKDVKIEVIK
jgi:hypothetical protein